MSAPAFDGGVKSINMKWIVALLLVILVMTNGFWLYSVVDQGVTNSYREQQLHELDETRKQLMAVLPELASKLHKEEVVAAVSKHTELNVYEKDGCTWAGWLALKFDEKGKLQSVSPIWSYSNDNPCFPNF